MLDNNGKEEDGNGWNGMEGRKDKGRNSGMDTDERRETGNGSTICYWPLVMLDEELACSRIVLRTDGMRRPPHRNA